MLNTVSVLDVIIIISNFMIRKQCQMASWRTSYLMITSQITLCILLVSNSTATTQTPASTESPTTTLTTHTVDETTIQTPASTESPTTTLTTHTVDETTIEIRHTTSHTSITSHITPPSDNPTTSKLQIMTDQITSTKTDETTTTKTDETTTAKTDETTTAKTDGTTTAKTDGNASVHESTTVEPQKTVTVKTDETTHFHTSHSTAQLSTASTTNRITSAQTSSTPLTTHTPATITNANPTESTGNQNLSSTFKISMPSNGPTASNIPPISTTSLKASTKNIQTDMHSTNAMTSAQISKDNDIYSTGCRTGTCELEIITSSTGTEKITNCCDTVHCNNDVKLLSNMASTFSSVFALLTVSVFHTFRYYVL
ncbi:hypothetical protein LOTGIDRAFT_168453 [Lottia gigantea]|uniref:Uncharacterized protein n=1 Tax=Lottia gigantea TaxID=225164 RepID=V3ZV07_LOTGI|nr:hypothetical protein LOTGIDRAFT_168453 [Lottia gigantea]ESO84781.1 hypothetical protein LOTGIDRAFT_168453 [Lottia gigantea]